jgi:hypothetical protein
MAEDVYRPGGQIEVTDERITIAGRSYLRRDISSVRVALLGMSVQAPGFNRVSGRAARVLRGLAGVLIISIILVLATSCIGLVSTIRYIADGRCCSEPDPTSALMNLVVVGLVALTYIILTIITMFGRGILWLQVAASVAAIASLLRLALTLAGDPAPWQHWHSTSGILLDITWACSLFILVVTTALVNGYGTSIVLEGPVGNVTAYRSWNLFAVHRLFVALSSLVAERNSH